MAATPEILATGYYEHYDQLQSVAEALSDRGITVAAIRAVEQEEPVITPQRIEARNMNAFAWNKLFFGVPEGFADYTMSDNPLGMEVLPGRVESSGLPSGNFSERYDLSNRGGSFVATLHVHQKYFACKMKTDAEVRDLYIRPGADPQTVSNKLATELAYPTHLPLERELF